MFPRVQFSISGVNGSHVSLATAGAIIEDEDPSLLSFDHPHRQVLDQGELTV